MKITQIIKPKAANAINWIFIIYGLLSYSQTKINGHYSVNKPLQERYETFRFNNDGSFKYATGGSLGNDRFGSGFYSVDGNKLVLEYITKPVSLGNHRVRVWDNKTDSVYINIKVHNIEKSPLPKSNILVKRFSNKTVFKLIPTSQNGMGQIAITKGNEKLIIETTCLGYKPHSLTVETGTSCNIDVYLQSQKIGIPIRDLKETFAIKELTKDSIVLINKDNTQLILTKK